MSELYLKLLNGEINIKYLSPTELIELEQYLSKLKVNLDDFLNELKEKNEKLESQKNQLKTELEDNI